VLVLTGDVQLNGMLELDLVNFVSIELCLYKCNIMFLSMDLGIAVLTCMHCNCLFLYCSHDFEKIGLYYKLGSAYNGVLFERRTTRLEHHCSLNLIDYYDCESTLHVREPECLIITLIPNMLLTRGGPPRP
jgi:hypothetical protein